MEDQRKFDSNNSNERSSDDSTQHEQAAARQSGEAGGNSHYYYAYGPYQSVKSEEPSATKMDAKDVEVTPPTPVKPLPFSSTTRTSYGQLDGQGNGGGQSGPSSNWQYKQPEKKRSSFRSMFVSFLAGALVVSTLMFTADYYNLFTSNNMPAATSNAGAAQTVANTNQPAPFPNGTTSVADVVKTAGPAVVKIETFSKSGGANSSNSWWYNDPYFRQFFGDSSGGNDEGSSSQGGQLQPLGIGTGFIFEKDGYILTNNHVIEGADQVQVYVDGFEKPFDAKVLGKSDELDLAVLKIEGEADLPTVQLGDSEQIAVGEQVVAIGNPSGFDHTVTTGVLSAKGREIEASDNGRAKKYTNLLQTDASINPGNSGGPLLNMKGEVIGMNVAVSKDAQGIGFAIPSNTITKVVEDLKANREIPKEPVPFIGATLASMTDQIATQLGTDVKEGALVTNVVFGSPAYEAELRAYDIITAIDGESVKTNQELIGAVSKKKVGDSVKLTVHRNGKSAEVSVKIGDRNKFEEQINQQQTQR
ncbi:S1C family serine protease [Paenibacillus aquistagni]|uniref:S1C family serine protease n=1 Tax=Paenibacillus aquistagni TaxID=1852522 RepID=UPI00145B4411|nr:trypsin-like peptidase domain-containing protein [Paenibacillus aquistagni]NMM53822.1 PDZ domain-containing protein [Paenibacillus aquistagni]